MLCTLNGIRITDIIFLFQLHSIFELIDCYVISDIPYLVLRILNYISRYYIPRLHVFLILMYQHFRLHQFIFDWYYTFIGHKSFANYRSQDILYYIYYYYYLLCLCLYLHIYVYCVPTYNIIQVHKDLFNTASIYL